MDYSATLEPYNTLTASSRTPPPQNLTSGHFLTRFGYRVTRPQGAGSWLLFFTTAGRGLFQQKEIQFTVGPGDITLLAPRAYSDYGVSPPSGKIKIPTAKTHDSAIQFLHLGKPTSGRFKRPTWQFHWVHFQAKKSWSPWMKIPEQGSGLYYYHLNHVDSQKRVKRAFQRIHTDRLQASDVSFPLTQTALEEILLVIHRDRPHATSPMDPRIQSTLETITANLSADHSVGSLAKRVSLSPSRFAHLFKQETGDSVTQLILKHRIRQSQELLATTQERICDIANALGFHCPFYFSRQFKSLVGQSPKSYRQAFR